MKVKKLIEILETLDQEKNIWVVYDSYESFEPCFEIATESVDDSKVGDYVMEVG